MIIAIGGKQLSGKTTFAEMLSREMALPVISTSDYLLEKVSCSLGLAAHRIAENKHLFRDEYEAVGDAQEALHGPAGVARMTLARRPQEDVIFESLRRGIEVSFFKNLPEVTFILMEADRDIRATRGKLANENAKTETEGVEALLKIPELIRVENNGSRDDLQKLAEEIASLF